MELLVPKAPPPSFPLSLSLSLLTSFTHDPAQNKPEGFAAKFQDRFPSKTRARSPRLVRSLQMRENLRRNVHSTLSDPDPFDGYGTELTRMNSDSSAITVDTSEDDCAAPFPVMEVLHVSRFYNPSCT